MAAWTLSDEQWDALDKFRFGTSDATVFRNATIILMSAVGRSKFSIARELGCCPATVDNVRKRYRQSGLSGLQPIKPRTTFGRNAIVSASVAGSGEYTAADFGLWLQRLVGGSPERAPEKADGDLLQRRPIASPASPGRIFVPTAQTHDEGQTR